MALIPRGYHQENPQTDPQNRRNRDTTAPQMDQDRTSESEPGRGSYDTDEDGRSKEWQDRGRINLHPDPSAKTNLERDFEPEDDDTSYHDRNEKIY